MDICLLDQLGDLIALTERKVFRKNAEWPDLIRDDLFDIDLLLVQLRGYHELAHQILLLLLLLLVLLLKSLDLLKLNYNLGRSEEVEKLIIVLGKGATLDGGVGSIHITLAVVIP